MKVIWDKIINLIFSDTYSEGVDYKTLSYEVRNIDLDHLKAPNNHVITGVKFRTLGSHLNMEVSLSKIF